MIWSNSVKCKVSGVVAPGFESVKQLYQNNMNNWAEDNTQLCIYYQGEKVVDLWASATSDSSFSADSLINIFSSGKSLESIAIASLVDKGLISYDAKIIDYWPEFGANGKEQVTVADLMRHEAGLANFDCSMELDALLTENIKLNSVGSIIEQQKQDYPRGDSGRREYHAVTRGWIVNELFRRVDPAARTIGEFLRQDINPLLETELIVGVTEEELPRISKVKPLGIGFQFLESLKPKFLGRRIVHNIFQLIGRIFRILPAIRRGLKSRPPAPFKNMDGIGSFNQKNVAMGETPSANTHSSARSLAKLAAMMSAGGTFHGKTYLSSQAWHALHEKAVDADMSGLFPSRFTQGGVNEFTQCTADSPTLKREFNVGREGFYGWMGLGGSIFQWHPHLDIGFAFVPTSLHVLDILNERGKTYQAETLRCVQLLRSSAADGQVLRR
ncbi:MAG: serine hydrolase domain-containing protein [Halioglobus sp.]